MRAPYAAGRDDHEPPDRNVGDGHHPGRQARRLGRLRGFSRTIEAGCSPQQPRWQGRQASRQLEAGTVGLETQVNRRCARQGSHAGRT
ncbi:MAG: hypothetical protein JO329_18250 [Planctomycetaceae bacterium]|nr:hypothetical protein [Planctomycetaceae bacterium]MBV8608459.1 hypothetical protein [Singulisphaera sp.]